jgi:hypothetical protein
MFLSLSEVTASWHSAILYCTSPDRDRINGYVSLVLFVCGPHAADQIIIPRSSLPFWQCSQQSTWLCNAIIMFCNKFPESAILGNPQGDQRTPHRNASMYYLLARPWREAHDYTFKKKPTFKSFLLGKKFTNTSPSLQKNANIHCHKTTHSFLFCCSRFSFCCCIRKAIGNSLFRHLEV